MTDELRWNLLARKKFEIAIIEAFRVFRQHGVEPILIKGWAAARNYPSDVPRSYGDIDIAVSADDYPRASALTDDPGSGLKGVDLHRELRHLDTSDWNQLFSRSELVPVDGGDIRVLAAEDHLRVLCVHWLTNGGEYRERLLDVVYAVQNRPDSFDWSRCLNAVSETRRSWIICTIGLAHKYMGLSLEGLPFADEAARLPDWLTRTVERSWSRDLRLRGLDESITNARQLIRQIRLRIPPNPIQATLNCEGPFDHGSRFGYQTRDMFGRLTPSIRRVSRAVRDQYRWMRSQ